jgi:hypothetical protein
MSDCDVFGSTWKGNGLHPFPLLNSSEIYEQCDGTLAWRSEESLLSTGLKALSPTHSLAFRITVTFLMSLWGNTVGPLVWSV